jgi:GGDEF domain-containing protein
MDVDRFKDVNDTLGHSAGDSLIKQVAQRLRSHVRSGDFIARYGGDEFAILWLSADPDVRPFLIVESAEYVEAILLLLLACRWRLYGFGLQGAVHALMPAVVLRAQRRDEARLDAEFQKPHRQPREPACACRSEW